MWNDEQLVNNSWKEERFNDTVQINFGACQKRKSSTFEVMLTFYWYNKTL